MARGDIERDLRLALEKCEQLLARGLTVPGSDMLMDAARNGHQHVCEWLLRSGRTERPLSSVYAAARGGHSGLAAWLLAAQPQRPAGLLLVDLLKTAAHGCSLAGLQALHAAWLQHEPQPQQQEPLSSNDQALVAVFAIGSPTACWREKAEWLAGHWARPDASGQWRILGDAAHKIVNPYLYRLDEVREIFGRISAPLLAVEASDDSLGQWWKGKYTLEEYHQRLQSVAQHRIARIEDAGHMLHHDQPQALAQLLEPFFQS